jgi:2,4-dienoyl-CoA reductase-like NADH-dependent reductase (Old Yellow Enzyme family)/thioredoxin reductase
MATDARFEKLLSPGRIGKMELKNRIIMAPMESGLADNGVVTELVRNYYEERAKGGVGLIIPGVLSIDFPMGASSNHQIAVSDDKYIPGLKTLTDVIHKHGAKIAAQFQHAGRLALNDMLQGKAPMTPSDMRIGGGEWFAQMTKEEAGTYVNAFSGSVGKIRNSRGISVDEIKTIVGRFGEAGERAKKSGFDGIEIHAGHGYLLDAFLSPYFNKRTDEYGGDLKNRARFLLEVIQAIRAKVGKDYPIWCRIDSREFGVDGGITKEDGLALALLLQDAGVDAIHVSGYGSPLRQFVDAPVCYEPSFLLPYAADIKKTVRIPVIAVGRITPEAGEAAIREGKADFIAMARALLADPELPNKLAAGQRSAIRPCIRCYQCIGQHLLFKQTICTVNPAIGKEADFRIKPAEKARKVAVIGSGPAGMEAALIAATRGHHVTIYEKNQRLGGSLVFASVVSSDNELLLDWMIDRVQELGVDIKMGTEVTPEFIQNLKADVTIVAVGPNISLPKIPGGERRNVMSGKDLREMMNGRDFSGKLPWWIKLALPFAKPVLQRLKPSTIASLTKIWLPVVGKNVVVIGGDLVAIELAEFLLDRGRKVTVVSTTHPLAPEMSIPRRMRVIDSLKEHGVTLLSNVTCDEITAEGAVITDKDKKKQTIKADTVVIAEGIKNNPELFQAVKGKLSEVYEAGDCGTVRLIMGAIEDGTKLGIKI